MPVVVVADGQTLATDCYVLAFANASQYGNNVYIAPDANLQDGLLDMCLLDALPPWRAARVALGMALGTLPRTGGAAYRHVRQARVAGQRPAGLPRRWRLPGPRHRVCNRPAAPGSGSSCVAGSWWLSVWV